MGLNILTLKNVLSDRPPQNPFAQISRLASSVVVDRHWNVSPVRGCRTGSMVTSMQTSSMSNATLWYLAAFSEYRTDAHLFWIARSTACEIVLETCEAIISLLPQQYNKYPKGSQLQSVVDGFFGKNGVSHNVVELLIDDIPVSPSAGNHTSFYNRKWWYSMIVKPIVDHDYLFRDINLGRAWLRSCRFRSLSCIGKL